MKKQSEISPSKALIKRAIFAEEKNRALMEENDLREKYMATLTHDLRTPVASSRMLAKMLDGSIVENEKKQKLYKHLVQELERADKMLNALLDYSKNEGEKKFPFIKKKLNLQALAEKYLEDLRIIQPGIQIHLTCDGEIIGKWSRDGLLRVLENLLSNAIKYGDASEPITVVMTEKKDTITMIVHNYGDPIPLREQKKIFEPFHRSTSAERNEKTGWGLGLSLVHTIIEGHEGSIRVKSSSDKGTSFIIELPKETEGH